MILQNCSGVQNVAIIAHVNHGKTILVDQLLQSAAKTKKKMANSNENINGSINDDTNMTDQLLDYGDLEKECWITITSKVTRIKEPPTGMCMQHV